MVKSRYEALLDELRDYYERDMARRAEVELSKWKVAVRADFLTLLQAEGKTTLLEIGAGTGKDGAYFQAHGLDVTCTDLSPAMVAACRQRGLKAEVKDFLSLDYEDDSFEAIYAMNCLLHVPNEDMPAVLANLRRLLAPAGLFFFGTYGGRPEESHFDRGPTTGQRFFAFRSDEGLKALVTPYFDLVKFAVISEGEIGSNGGLRFQNTIWRRPIS